MPRFLSEDDIESEIIRVTKDPWGKGIRADRRVGTLARRHFRYHGQECLSYGVKR